jgi:SWI/SNF-related matrix-associated actin-dependent regulator of chromatin subfamily A3
MDSRQILVEAETTGPKDYYECPIALKLMGTNDPAQRAILKNKMKAAKLPLEELMRQEREEKAREKAHMAAKKEREKMIKAAEKGGMSMPGSQGSSQIPPGSGEFVGGSSQTDLVPDQMVEQFGMKDDDLANMDKADQPTMVKTKLLPYQLQVSFGDKTLQRRGIFKSFEQEIDREVQIEGLSSSWQFKKRSRQNFRTLQLGSQACFSIQGAQKS